MTRDEIYEHLAKVYLGKRENVAEEKKKKAINQSWLVINAVITAVIVISTVYGFTAFLTRRAGLQNPLGRVGAFQMTGVPRICRTPTRISDPDAGALRSIGLP